MRRVAAPIIVKKAYPFTFWPLARSWSTTCAPRNPDAPVTFTSGSGPILSFTLKWAYKDGVLSVSISILSCLEGKLPTTFDDILYL